MSGSLQWHSTGLVSVLVIVIVLGVGLYKSQKLRTEASQAAVQHILLVTAATTALFLLVVSFGVGPVSLPELSYEAHLALRSAVASVIIFYGNGFIKALCKAAVFYNGIEQINSNEQHLPKEQS